MKLVIGLGNPGKQYIKTRHNAGFIFLDALHDSLLKTQSVSRWELSKKFNAEIAEGTFKGQKIILAKPMTFMNLSGQTAQLISHYYKLKPADTIVAHDDKDLKLGDCKIQTDKGHAGHNGVRSIIEHLGTKSITRIRLGIAPENPKKIRDSSVFVLSKFALLEKKPFQSMIKKAVELSFGLLQDQAHK
ncbi:MAG: aminoacyl-tRNA hydrolase [Candidatus Magasanikbacteria bacterium]|nr:aminoacyl-tRNA hydrolase [Candidatus Magasanikbacteria bacterium]